MKAFFVAIDCLLTRRRLAAVKQRLADLLTPRGVDLCALEAPEGMRSLVVPLAAKASGAIVVAIDDGCPLPAKARWLCDLSDAARALDRRHRPRLIYVTRNATAAGESQASGHDLVRDYVGRDDKGRWIDHVAEMVLDLAEPAKEDEPSAIPADPTAWPDIVGVSPCFRQAVAELTEILRSPYGLVTGERGVGKMFLIRAIWRHLRGSRRLIVLPCGSFFKDYYVAGIHRRFAGGREAVDDLRPYIKESQNGLLVLHHVEELPTALQEELAVRLASSMARPDQALRVSGVDREGLQEYDVTIVATSTFSPELLRQTGRLIPDLASKLRRRHVRIPSLAERGKEDLRLLCEDMVRRISLRRKSDVCPQIDEDVFSILAAASWPENLSDLVRVLEYAVWHAPGGKIRPAHLPGDLESARQKAGSLTLDEIVARAQRTAIENTLQETGGNVAAAAKRLGRDEKGLYRTMIRLGMGCSAKKAGRRRKTKDER